MRMLLQEAFRILKRERVPLSYLIPVEEAIYTPFGYGTVGRLQRERHISEERLREYSLYCIRNSAYQRLIAGEERLIDAQRQAIIGFKREIDPFSEDQFAFCLYQIDRNEFLFTFSMGHALLDGISMFLLLDRLFRYYNADDSGPYVEEPSFVRYAQWLADFRNSPAGEQRIF